MLAIYGTAILIVAASLVAGMALLRLLGRERPTWLSGAVGFAALTVAAPILLRLPGRAATAAILLFLLLAAGAAYVWRATPGVVALATTIVVLAAGSLPFLFNDATG